MKEILGDEYMDYNLVMAVPLVFLLVMEQSVAL